jgi:hypothetical protein
MSAFPQSGCSGMPLLHRVHCVSRSDYIYDRECRIGLRPERTRLMSDSKRVRASTFTILVGILTLAIGTIPLLTVLGVLPRGNDASDAAPLWIGWLIGMVFVGAGILVIIKGIVGNADDASGSLPAGAPRLLRAIYDRVGVALVGSLAAVFSWVAFGPGARHFSVHFFVPAGGLSMPTSGAGDTLGRVAFGIVAVMIWGFAVALVVMTVRRWRR